MLEDSLPPSNIVPQTSKPSLNVTSRGNLDHQVSNCGLLRSVSFLCFLLMSILTDSTCRAPKSFLPRPLLPPKLVKWRGQAGVSRAVQTPLLVELQTILYLINPDPGQETHQKEARRSRKVESSHHRLT
jgi:hypothetical protein